MSATQVQTEQIQSGKNSNVDFSHRLSGSTTNSLISLTDSIGMMTERARGILVMLSCHFDDSGDRLSDVIISSVINAALQEVEDIEATITAYCAAEKDKIQV